MSQTHSYYFKRNFQYGIDANTTSIKIKEKGPKMHSKNCPKNGKHELHAIV
jgi:hypothetical protein